MVANDVGGGGGGGYSTVLSWSGTSTEKTRRADSGGGDVLERTSVCWSEPIQ